MKKEYQSHLSKEEKSILVNKGTESPFTGEYDSFFINGEYVCKGCDSKLFSSVNKFKSNCGWPSFDESISGNVEKKVDKSVGRVRTEIICSKCNGHLGHVFEGENYTIKNTRYCVNSLSLKFKSNKK
jgi:methionine-R-sulfoxide reductase